MAWPLLKRVLTQKGRGEILNLSNLPGRILKDSEADLSNVGAIHESPLRKLYRFS